MAMMGSGYERRPEPEAPAGPRLRVYELAKDLNVQPKDLLNKIRAMGLDVANHMSQSTSRWSVDRVPSRVIERERWTPWTVVRPTTPSSAAAPERGRGRPRVESRRRRRSPRPVEAPAPRSAGARRAAVAVRARGVGAASGPRARGHREADAAGCGASRSARRRSPARPRAAGRAAASAASVASERSQRGSERVRSVARRQSRRPRGPGAPPRRARDDRRSRWSPDRRRRARSSSAPARDRRGDRAGAALRDQDHATHAGGGTRPTPMMRQPGAARNQFGRPGVGTGVAAGRRPARSAGAAPARRASRPQITTPAEHKRVIRIEDTITVADLARGWASRRPEVLKKLWGMGMTGVNINAAIDFETAPLIASEFGYEVQNVAFKEDELLSQQDATRTSAEDRCRARRSSRSWATSTTARRRCSTRSARRTSRPARPAASRSTSARTRSPANGRRHRVPRHAGPRGVHRDARARRAGDRHRRAGRRGQRRRRCRRRSRRSTTPRTRRCRSSSRSTRSTCRTPTRAVIAQQLADHGLIPEEWGGDTIYVNVSAKPARTSTSCSSRSRCQAEVLELRANADKPALGARHRGAPRSQPRSDGDRARPGRHAPRRRHARRRPQFGKVRAMLDDPGESVERPARRRRSRSSVSTASPTPATIVNVAPDDKVAKQVVEHRRAGSASASWRRSGRDLAREL